jgi:hypothetical protein
MRVKLIGVSDEARKSESVDRAKQDRRRLLAALFDAYRRSGSSATCSPLKCGLAAPGECESFEEADDFERTSAESPQIWNIQRVPYARATDASFRFICPPQDGFAVANMNLISRAPSSANSITFIRAPYRRRNPKSLSATVVLRRRHVWLRRTNIAAPAAER